jgi:hypothetical protein
VIRPAARRSLLRALGGTALVIAAELPPPDARARTVVIFHGNGETLGGRMPIPGAALQVVRGGHHNDLQLAGAVLEAAIAEQALK